MQAVLLVAHKCICCNFVRTVWFQHAASNVQNPYTINNNNSGSARQTNNAAAISQLFYDCGTGLFWELNPGPVAPKARIIPLDQTAAWVRIAKHNVMLTVKLFMLIPLHPLHRDSLLALTNEWAQANALLCSCVHFWLGPWRCWHNIKLPQWSHERSALGPAGTHKYELYCL